MNTELLKEMNELVDMRDKMSHAIGLIDEGGAKIYLTVTVEDPNKMVTAIRPVDKDSIEGGAINENMSFIGIHMQKIKVPEETVVKEQVQSPIATPLLSEWLKDINVRIKKIKQRLINEE